jgi:arylsulfatase A-like enzyme
LGLAVAVLAVLLAACGRERPGVRVEWLADHGLSRMKVERSVERIRLASVDVGFDRRHSIVMAAPAEVIFSGIPIAREAVFRTATAVAPDAVRALSDGAGFEASCRGPRGEWISLVGPMSTGKGPRSAEWVELSASLAACSRPTTDLRLTTSCGEAGDCRNDSACWAEPRIELEGQGEIRPRRLVLLISIDTLRPDHLQAFGAARETSPNLQRLARDGVVFETVVAPSPWTIPSHASLFTSTFPLVHGADANHAFSDELASLTRVFRKAGWSTAAFVDSPFLGKRFGFDRGFEHFERPLPPAGDPLYGGKVVVGRLISWLEKAPEGPAYVFWHLMDVHGPYGASAPYGGRFRGRIESAEANAGMERIRRVAIDSYLDLNRFRSVEDVIAGYDEGIAAADGAIGSLLDRLRSAGIYDQATIVVTADHGESLFQHGLFLSHGVFLTDDEIRVPLILKLPGGRLGGTRESSMLRLVDVAPSLLKIEGLPIPESFQGSSIDESLGLAASGKHFPRVAFGNSDFTGSIYVRTPEWKYISKATRDRGEIEKEFGALDDTDRARLRERLEEQLYDLRSDPAELRSLVGENPPELERYRLLAGSYLEESKRLRAGIAEKSTADGLADEDARSLEALGYLSGSGAEATGPRAEEAQSSSTALDPSSCAGRRPPLPSLQLNGYLERLRQAGDFMELTGWAADRFESEAAVEIALFVDDRCLVAGPPNVRRPDIRNLRTGRPIPTAGFRWIVRLPGNRGERSPKVEVFALWQSGDWSLLSTVGGYDDPPRSGEPRFEVVADCGGRSIPVDSGEMTGSLESFEVGEGRLRIGGWGVDVVQGEPARQILVSDGKQCLGAVVPRIDRPDVVRAFGKSSVRRSGFEGNLPVGVEAASRSADFRVFAVSGRGRASQISRPPN